MDILNNIKTTEQDINKAATFILNIKFRQNKSWQGSIEWLEEKKTLSFRSALELINIIEDLNSEGYKVDILEKNEM